MMSPRPVEFNVCASGLTSDELLTLSCAGVVVVSPAVTGGCDVLSWAFATPGNAAIMATLVNRNLRISPPLKSYRARGPQSDPVLAVAPCFQVNAQCN